MGHGGKLLVKAGHLGIENGDLLESPRIEDADPLPGTELYEVCRREGYLPEDQEFWYESADNMINQPSMSEGDLNRVWKEFRSLQREIETKYE